MDPNERRFSYVVEEYFNCRESYPVLLSYREQCVSDSTLDELQNTAFQTFHDLDGVEVLSTEQVHGDFWAGVLIELSGSTHTDEPNDVLFGEMEQSCIPIANDLHREFATGTAPTVGFSCGESVYAASCLQALGQDYFQREKRPRVK